MCPSFGGGGPWPPVAPPWIRHWSPSKIPLHLSQIFLVVYLKVPSLAHLFSLFIQLLLALSSQRTESNTTSMLMTPICTLLSLLQIQLHHLKYSPILSLTYSPGWTLTNCSSIYPKPNSYSKNYIGFQSNNASITNCVFLHIKRFKFNNLPIFTIVFLFLLTQSVYKIIWFIGSVHPICTNISG